MNEGNGLFVSQPGLTAGYIGWIDPVFYFTFYRSNMTKPVQVKNERRTGLKKIIIYFSKYFKFMLS